MTTFMLLIAYYLLITQIINLSQTSKAKTILVSRSGIDANSCAITTIPCGTLYYASTVAKSGDEIYVMDGQNQAEIANKPNSQYHPCLPQPFTNLTNKITITFGPNITYMNNWYPSVCNNTSTQQYINDYMFQVNQASLSINNLHIDNYRNDINFGIMGVTNTFGSKSETDSKSHLSCSSCVFEHIINNNNNDIHMIYSTRNMDLIDNTFNDIQSANDFIVMGYKHLNVTDTRVYNIKMNQSFIKILAGNTHDSDDAQNTIDFQHATFVDIDTKISLINDQYISCKINVTDVKFINVESGAIWLGEYRFDTEINLEDIIISTSQIFPNNNNYLLGFSFADDITVENMQINYSYDLYSNCNETENGYYEHMNTQYVMVDCQYPVQLISNSGNMVVNDITFSINISQNDIDIFKTTNYPNYDIVVMRYLDEPESFICIITNYGNMNINRLHIRGFLFAQFFIYNFGKLHIDEMMVIWDDSNRFDPNALQPRNIIVQSKSNSELLLNNSYLIGGGVQIAARSGFIHIYNTQFSDATRSVYVQAAQEVVINSCSFVRVGRYFGNFYFTKLQVLMTILEVKRVTGKVNIESNELMNGYDDFYATFLWLNGSENAVLRNNTFAVDGSNIYYSDFCGECFREEDIQNYYGLSIIGKNNQNISIIENNFLNKTYLNIFRNAPWLYLESKPTSPICLSANNFTNYAINIKGESNITSCFRPELFDCFFLHGHCSDGLYGNMSKELNQKQSNFNIDWNYNGPVFNTYYYPTVYIALDNTRFNVIGFHENATYNHSQIKPLQISQSNLFLLDSIITPYDVDIWYNDSCNVIYNDRLTDKLNYIAKAMIMCNDSRSVGHMIYLRNSSTLKEVDYFSASQVHFNSTDYTYFPGKKLTFQFQIFDQLNNKINNDLYSSEFMINLENNELEFAQSIQIKQQGVCKMCDAGLIIPTISLEDVTKNNTHVSHELITSLSSGNLALISNDIPLTLQSCPKGYGPDENNFTCYICDDGKYNLYDNNTAPCKSCNQNTYDGILCYGGDIYISNNYWADEGDDYGVNNGMVTESCPGHYCCTEEKCNYDDKHHLCAFGRDPSTSLCGQCIDGYSQTMNSTKCAICHGNDYLWLVPAFILALAITFYLISCHPYSRGKPYSPPPPRTPLENKSCVVALYSNRQFVLMVKTFGSRVLLYYFQAVTQVLWPSTIAVWLYTIASAFDMTISLDAQGQTWCFIEGLTTKQKLLASGIPMLLIVILLIFISGWIWLLRRFNCEKEIKCCCNNCKEIKCKPCNTNFAKAFVVMLLICVGQVLSILFKLLNCHSIGNVWVHFYFGEEVCFETFTFAGAIIGLSIVVLIFAVIFWKLSCKMTDKERNDPNQPLNSYCKYYKEKYYWWESIILSRRISIALLAMFYNNYYYITVVVIVLLGFLFIHTQKRPFLSEQANTMESFTLGCLIIIITIQNTMHLYEIEDVATYILTSFVLLPVVSMFIYTIYEAYKVIKYPFGIVQKSQNSAPPSISLHCATSLNKTNDSSNIPLNLNDVTDDLSDDDEYEDEQRNIQAKPYVIQLQNLQHEDIEDEHSPLYVQKLTL